MWEVWDKTSNINNLSASEVLDRYIHLKNEDVIFIKKVEDKICEIQGKSILSKLYKIDASLDNEVFIDKYIEITSAVDELTNSEATES